MKTPFVLAMLLATALCPAARGQSQDPIKVRVYSSLTTGTSDKHVRATGKPLADYIAANVNAKINLDIYHGETADDLIAFGKKLNDGEFDFGEVWGIEYGWLKQHYPKLEPQVTLWWGKVGVKSQIMVGKSITGDRLADIRGKRLAVYSKTPLADTLYLEQRIGGAKSFFGEIKSYATFREAALAVNRGDADCLVVGVHAYSKFESNLPNCKLRALDFSEEFAPAVLIGRRDTFDKKHLGLWLRMAEELSSVHLSDEGREFCRFWRIQKFIRSNAEFEALVNENVDRYPKP